MGSVTKTYKIKSDVEAVYKALIDPIEIEQWSGSEATMNTSPQGEFSLWGGSIHGVNMHISKHRIEQNWKEDKWESYSNVIFDLSESEEGVILKLTHTDIPEDSVRDIDAGWDDYYLEPLKFYLES